MVQDKNAWDIVEIYRRVNDLENRMRTTEAFKESTVEKLLVVFKTLEELKDGDKWIKRVFITSLVGATISSAAALIVWAIQN